MDNVHSPSHYQHAGIETKDYIRAVLGEKGWRDSCIANVLKYVSRYALKNGVEDLKKAQVYLGWAIETMERK